MHNVILWISDCVGLWMVIHVQAMGRQRLRPGARPRYQYPSNATASQGQPRPPQASPPGPPGNWL